MKKIIGLIVLIGTALPAAAQLAPVNGWCEQGAKTALLSGMSSTNKLQGIIPGCLVTPYLTGTTTLATYYLTPTGGTPQTGPFTANTTTGQFLFYAANGVGLDIVRSSGTTQTGVFPFSAAKTYALTAAATGGAAPGTTFNGSAAVTYDYHSVGAAQNPATVGGGQPCSGVVNGNSSNSTANQAALQLCLNAGGHYVLPSVCQGSLGPIYIDTALVVPVSGVILEGGGGRGGSYNLCPTVIKVLSTTSDAFDNGGLGNWLIPSLSLRDISIQAATTSTGTGVFLAPNYCTPANCIWSSVNTYGVGNIQIVNGVWYMSIQAGNTNKPPASSPTWWIATPLNNTSAALYPAAYNAGTTYAQGAEVLYNTHLWISIVGSNTGNTPANGAYWQNADGGYGGDEAELTNVEVEGFARAFASNGYAHSRLHSVSFAGTSTSTASATGAYMFDIGLSTSNDNELTINGTCYSAGNATNILAGGALRFQSGYGNTFHIGDIDSCFNPLAIGTGAGGGASGDLGDAETTYGPLVTLVANSSGRVVFTGIQGAYYNTTSSAVINNGGYLTLMNPPPAVSSTPYPFITNTSAHAETEVINPQCNDTSSANTLGCVAQSYAGEQYYESNTFKYISDAQSPPLLNQYTRLECYKVPARSASAIPDSVFCVGRDATGAFFQGPNLLEAVPNTTSVNGQPLTSNVTIPAATPTVAGTVIQIANSTLTVTSGTVVNANSCNGPYTVSMTGVTTGMTFQVTATSDTHAVTGWGAPAAGVLYITDYPTAGTFNYYVCNNSASSITTGGSVTFNVSAR